MGSELVPDREWILAPRSPCPRSEMRRRTYRPRTGRFLGTETPRRDRTCFPGNTSDVTPIGIQGSTKGVARPPAGPLRKSDRDRSGIRPRTHPGTGRSPRLDGARGETAGSVHHSPLGGDSPAGSCVRARSGASRRRLRMPLGRRPVQPQVRPVGPRDQHQRPFQVAGVFLGDCLGAPGLLSSPLADEAAMGHWRSWLARLV